MLNKPTIINAIAQNNNARGERFPSFFKEYVMTELIVLCFTAGLLLGSLITWFIIDINAYYRLHKWDTLKQRKGGRS